MFWYGQETIITTSRHGRLGLTNFTETSSIEYENSRKVTSALSQSIIDQQIEYSVNKEEIRKIKNEIKQDREGKFKNILDFESVRNVMNNEQRRLNEINREKGVSNWLTVLPIAENGFNLNKQQFWDCIRLRYGWHIANLPSMCACGAKFDLQQLHELQKKVDL